MLKVSTDVDYQEVVSGYYCRDRHDDLPLHSHMLSCWSLNQRNTCSRNKPTQLLPSYNLRAPPPPVIFTIWVCIQVHLHACTLSYCKCLFVLIRRLKIHQCGGPCRGLIALLVSTSSVSLASRFRWISRTWVSLWSISDAVYQRPAAATNAGNIDKSSVVGTT